MTLYNANGQINTTSVPGSSYTGLYAPDGSYNIVTNASGSYVGLHHACGAYNAVVVTDPSASYYNTNGSLNVIANSSSPSGFSSVQPAGINTVPSWVLAGASVDMDFANNRFFGGTTSNLLSITRASNATDLLPSSTSGYVYNTYGSNILSISPTFGLLIFEARTNLLLNSTVPATQTTASLGTGSYTLWVNGSGSALASGGTATITGAASATNGSSNTFTVTVAGTITVTVTGSLNAFQLELGAFGTSFIVTAGATATRAADNISGTGALLTALGGAAYSLFANVKTAWPTGNFNIGLIGVNGLSGGPSPLYMGTTAGQVSMQNGSFQALTAALGSGAWQTGAKVGSSTTVAGGRSIVGNNGTLATDANVGITITTLQVGRIGSSYLNGSMAELAAWNSRLADATLKGLTV